MFYTTSLKDKTNIPIFDLMPIINNPGNWWLVWSNHIRNVITAKSDIRNKVEYFLIPIAIARKSMDIVF